MRSELPSSILVRRGLNGIATAIIRRAFAGAIFVQCHFLRTRSQSPEPLAAPKDAFAKAEQPSQSWPVSWWKLQKVR